MRRPRGPRRKRRQREGTHVEARLAISIRRNRTPGARSRSAGGGAAGRGGRRVAAFRRRQRLDALLAPGPDRPGELLAVGGRLAVGVGRCPAEGRDRQDAGAVPEHAADDRRRRLHRHEPGPGRGARSGDRRGTLAARSERLGDRAARLPGPDSRHRVLDRRRRGAHPDRDPRRTPGVHRRGDRQAGSRVRRRGRRRPDAGSPAGPGEPEHELDGAGDGRGRHDRRSAARSSTSRTATTTRPGTCAVSTSAPAG